MRIKRAHEYIGSLTTTIAYCMRLSWNASKPYTIVRLFSQIANSGISMLLTFLTARLINLMSGNSPRDVKFSGLVILSLLVFTLLIFRMLLGRASVYVNELHNELLQQKLKNNMMSMALSADLSFFDSPQYNDSFANVTRDMHAAVSVVWSAVRFVTSVATLVGTLAILMQINVLFALLIGISLLPSMLVEQKYDRKLYKWSLENVRDERQTSYCYNIATDRLYAQEVRFFDLGNYIRCRYKRIWELFASKRKAIFRKRMKVNAVLSLLPEICMAALLFYISVQVVDGIRLIGDYSLYSGILMQCSAAMYATVSSMFAVHNEKLRVDNVRAFERLSVSSIMRGEKLLIDVESIEFKDVCFIYPDTNEIVLSNVSFRIGKGEKICIVGVNGAGKTTIIKLLLRFYDVTEGQILVNGVDIREYDIGSLRKCFSSFLQQVITYAFSIRENVQLSDIYNESKGDRHVLDAMRQAEAIDIVNNADKGLDAYLASYFSDDGLELSGGQRQRVSLARTFYRDCSVMILDEPSASLDPEAEHRIFRLLEELYSDKTTIFTSHRLSNVSLADRIILIENGMLIEQGTHKELMKNAGRYAQLYRYQADKYAVTE